jgi:hypothetical protein
VPHDTLNIFDGPLLLCEGCDRSADNLKRQLGQLQFAGDLMKNAFAIVVRVKEAAKSTTIITPTKVRAGLASQRTDSECRIFK